MAEQLRSEQSYSWTQPLCEACWPGFIGSDREPVTVIEAPMEECCHCALSTDAGIYIRVDPNGHFCAHPTHRSSS